MASTLGGIKTSHMSHVQLYVSMSSLTNYNVVPPGFSNGFINKVPGIHLSSQIETVDPSPTRFTKPLLRASLPATITGQVAHEDFGALACRKPVSWKYLAFKTLTQKEFGLLINLHPCLSKSARLNICKYRKPIQPLTFGVASESEEIQCMDLFVQRTAPLIFCHTRGKTFAAFFCEKETSHAIRRNSLYNLFEQSIPSRTGYLPFRPTLDFASDSLP